MIELLLFFLRFVSDYFWEYKAISLLGAVASLMSIVAVSLKKLRHRPRLEIYRNELLILILALIFFVNALIYRSPENTLIVGKVIISISMFFLGRHLHSSKNKYVYTLYIPIYLLIIYSFISGSGFQQWGDVTTFSGGYFFKTDLALALTIFTVFLLISDVHQMFKVMFVALNFLIVFYSNARVYYVIFPLVCFVYYYREFVFANARYTLKMAASLMLLTLVFIQVFSFIIKNISSGSNLLFFDFSQGFSSVNTQGRNIIWENLILHYADSGIVKQMFGAGLTADVDYAQNLYWLEGFNAHNTYLYLLVSLGALGLFVFLCFIYVSLKRFMKIASSNVLSSFEKENLFCFLSFAIIFLISGLTNVTIIFQQVSYFFFFYCGFLYNKNMFPSFYLTK